MSPTNARGQYGTRPHVGAEAMPPQAPKGSMIGPVVIGGVLLIAGVAGVALLRAHAARYPRLTAHEKEVRAWEAEFPGLPWYMDQVKDARQLDLWERARDHWERTR